MILQIGDSVAGSNIPRFFQFINKAADPMQGSDAEMPETRQYDFLFREANRFEQTFQGAGRFSFGCC